MPHALLQILLVACGGALGAVARFLTSKALLTIWPAYLGVGTLVVNVAGSFAIGLVMGWATHRHWLTDEWRIFLVPGILGGLTTFSSLAYETVLISRTESTSLGGGHLLANLVLGLLAVLAGDAASRMIG
jgi:CrcB protein